MRGGRARVVSTELGPLLQVQLAHFLHGAALGAPAAAGGPAGSEHPAAGGLRERGFGEPVASGRLWERGHYRQKSVVVDCGLKCA